MTRENDLYNICNRVEATSHSDSRFIFCALSVYNIIPILYIVWIGVCSTITYSRDPLVSTYTNPVGGDGGVTYVPLLYYIKYIPKIIIHTIILYNITYIMWCIIVKL